MIEPTTDDGIVLKRIMIDVLKLKNGMEDNLLVIQKCSLLMRAKNDSLAKVFIFAFLFLLLLLFLPKFKCQLLEPI